jgi:hypothetical protein
MLRRARLIFLWLIVDAAVVFGILATDVYIMRDGKHLPEWFDAYFLGSLVLIAVLVFAQAIAAAVQYWRGSKWRGTFYLLHFLVWLVIAYLTIWAHFIMLGAPSVGEH